MEGGVIMKKQKKQVIKNLLKNLLGVILINAGFIAFVLYALSGGCTTLRQKGGIKMTISFETKKELQRRLKRTEMKEKQYLNKLLEIKEILDKANKKHEMAVFTVKDIEKVLAYKQTNTNNYGMRLLYQNKKIKSRGNLKMLEKIQKISYHYNFDPKISFKNPIRYYIQTNTITTSLEYKDAVQIAYAVIDSLGGDYSYLEDLIENFEKEKEIKIEEVQNGLFRFNR